MTPQTRRIARSVVAAAGIAAWGASFMSGDFPRVWRALLVNFTYFVSLSAGMLCWSAIMTAARGKWMRELERIPLSGYGFAVPSMVSLAALWVGAVSWAPWATETFHQGLWLN